MIVWTFEPSTRECLLGWCNYSEQEKKFTSPTATAVQLSVEKSHGNVAVWKIGRRGIRRPSVRIFFSPARNTHCVDRRGSERIRALKRTRAKLDRKIRDTRQRNEIACNSTGAERQRETISICSDKFRPISVYVCLCTYVYASVRGGIYHCACSNPKLSAKIKGPELSADVSLRNLSNRLQ